MAYEVPPPDRRLYSKQIAAMDPGTDLFFPDAAPRTIRVIVSKLRRAHEGRLYMTKTEDQGVRVWRTQ